MESGEISNDIETPNFKCELNTLSRADGSCILCHNESVMAAAVYGPVEVKLHKMLIDKASVEVIFKPQSGQSQISDRLYESIISRICSTAIITTSYPRTSIYIMIQEMQNLGDMLACCINATCLALIHSGIAMNYLFAAASTKIPSSDTDNGKRVGRSESRITFVFENTSDKVLAIDSCGKISESDYKKSLDTCRQSSAAVFKFYKDMISKYALKM